MQQNQKVLGNGLNTLFINSPGSKAASVQMWFRAGSALEKKEDFGIAHFLEHMFFKGTQKRPGAKIAREVENFGGEINAFTSFDYTCYYINTPSNHISKTVEILMDMVSNPLFDEKELIPERNVVHEEYRRALDNPNQFNFKELQKSAFTRGYSHQILGTEKNILNFSRKQLTGFRKKFYNLSNALFVVAGDIKNQKKIESIINNFQIPKGPSSSFPAFKLEKKESINIHSKPVNQSTMTLTIEAPNYLHKNGASEDLAINCISHGEISPLYNSLVTQTSFASSVSGSTMFFSDGGAHFLKIAFPTDNFQKVISEFTKKIQHLLENDLTDEEISRIKNQYIASKIYERESIESHSFALGHGFAQNGDINCEDEFIENIKNTSIQEVQISLKDIFSKNIHITIQHPENEKIENINSTLETMKKNIKLTALNAKTEIKEKDISSKYDPEVKIVDIKKGIRLLYRKNNMTPTFVLHAYLKGGLAHESEETNGQYYFLSRLLTYGYDKTDFFELKNDLENKSSYLSGFSGKNAYGLTLHGLTTNFDNLLNHFSRTLINPQIPSNYLKLEKELIKRTIENQKEDPIKACFKKVNAAIFNNHPYRFPVFGTHKSISKISRKSLIELQKENLKNSEILITYCGDLDLNSVKKKVTNSLKELETSATSKKTKNKIKPLEGVKDKVFFDREQTQVFIGRSSYKSNQIEDLYLKILTSYLSGQSSELFVDVRDRKGLCYAVQPIQHTALEAGYWGIYIGTGSEKTELAKKAIIEILNKLQKKGLSKSEFKRVQKMIDGQNQMSVQTNDDYANFYSIPVLHGLGLDYQHESFIKIRNIKHDDFNKFLSKFLKADWTIIEAGK